MNERIEKFARECGAWNQVYGNRMFMIDEHFDIEKFAELIIGHATECVRDVLREENSDLTYPAATQVQNRIKQYFGVDYSKNFGVEQ